MAPGVEPVSPSDTIRSLTDSRTFAGGLCPAFRYRFHSGPQFQRCVWDGCGNGGRLIPADGARIIWPRCGRIVGSNRVRQPRHRGLPRRRMAARREPRDHFGPAVHELPDGVETINAQMPHSEPWGLRNAEGKVITSSPGAPE